jgi:ASC-1-like (ASCH) protein
MNPKLTKQPSTFEVADLLREKKLFFSDLNFVSPRNWNEGHYKEWNVIKGNLEIIVKKSGMCTRNIKVLRISDGKTYESIRKFVGEEGLYKILAEKLLEEGVLYKKIYPEKVEKIIGEKKTGNSVKVERVFDGKFYDTITECRLDNGYSKIAIYDLIREGLIFKKI